MKKVVIITTGGTIAMRYDAKKKGCVPAVGGAELIEAVPPLADVCPIEVCEFANIPSPHMTPMKMLELAQKAESVLKRDDVCGVVITHGTDTLEETAYFLDLAVNSDKPVCLTAAMRSSAEISPDGPKNILCAVKAASATNLYAGAFVVLNEEIHAAREVTKTHAANPKTFASPFWGPIGYVDDDRVIIGRQTLYPQKIITDRIETDVHLIKLAAGSDDFLLRALVDRGVKGIVIEGLGRGNVPPALVPGIKHAIACGVTVVLTSRTFGGRVLDVYAYDGGAKQLKEAGVIMAGELSGQKARIMLMLALSVTTSKQELEKYFDTP